MCIYICVCLCAQRSTIFTLLPPVYRYRYVLYQPHSILTFPSLPSFLLFCHSSYLLCFFLSLIAFFILCFLPSYFILPFLISSSSIPFYSFLYMYLITFLRKTPFLSVFLPLPLSFIPIFFSFLIPQFIQINTNYRMEGIMQVS